jgi:biopolymer transport protein ExbD
MSNTGSVQGILSGINVTPLCDIFVVLLIIFMLAMDQTAQQGPAVDLPQAGIPAASPGPGCTLTLTRDLGGVWLDGERLSLEGLPARLQSALGTAAGRLMVRTDPEVPLERVVKVMGIARKNGAREIGLGTRLGGS